MSQPAITIDNLSKRYRIGLREKIPDTLVSALAGWVTAPLQNLRRLRELNTFRNNDGRSDDTIWALRDVSFDVTQGEVIGVIGRNGAGKSTLLKILSRVTEPTHGSARVRGRVSSLLEVGTGFHPELTGRDNVYLNGTILGMTKLEIDRKFDDIVAFSGVEKFLDTPTKRYSSGMAVRLAFSVAAHLEPEILIVDEVLAVGDAEFQKRCLGKMRDVAGSGRTVLFVSHNMMAVQSFCSRALLLKNGRIDCEGDVRHVVTKYLSSTSRGVTQREWSSPSTAPGNDLVRLASARVATAQKSQPDAAITTADAIEVATEYWSLASHVSTHLTYTVMNDQGLILFSTFGASVAHPVGRHKRIFTIPAKYLNAGLYFLSLHVVRDGTTHVLGMESLLSFEIVDRNPRDNGWMGREPGILRPDLTWTLEQIE